MTAYNKIGFHTSPGGTAVGLGVWMRALDAKRIPFCVKGANSAGPVWEGQQLAQASGVPHVLIFRRSGEGWDVPDYSLPPADAARVHWDRHRDRFPPELDKNLVWFETINEVDKNRSDWLGHFAYHTGLIALEEGYRFAAFGWSSGEPEREHWETPGMMRYLRLCADPAHRDRLAVSIHEYSYTNADIQHEYPYKVGRFQMLFDVCDAHHVPRPTILITEWGWEYNSVPEPDVAMGHIRWAADLYARHEQILGACLWHLGGGYGGIANKAQKLIAPIQKFTLETAYPNYPLLDRPPQTNRFDFVADVTIPDGTVCRSGEPLVKTWRLKNSGDTTWSEGYALAFVAGEQMGAPPLGAVPLPAAAPGDEVEVTVALTAPEPVGTYRSYWQPQDSQGTPFGRPIWAEIEVRETPEAAEFNQYQFVADVTVPDGMELGPGRQFIKTWRVRNTGTTTWKKNYQLAFVSGNQMAGPLARRIHKNVPPGETTTISVPLKAPAAPGTYHGNWHLRTDQGEAFGAILWVEIKVPGPVTAVDGFHWPVGNRVNLEGWADANPFLRRNSQGEYHPGADFNDMGYGDHDLGAPIYAIAHGRVTEVGHWPVWGNLILVEHLLPDGGQVWSQYAHCKEMLVKQGDVVGRGDKIGTIGKGDEDRYWAHLHFEIRCKDFHIASWQVRDPELVKANYHDPMRFIRENFAPVE